MEEYHGGERSTPVFQYSSTPLLHYSNIPLEPLNFWAGRGYS
jgi:hypothetical protein